MLDDILMLDVDEERAYKEIRPLIEEAWGKEYARHFDRESSMGIRHLPAFKVIGAYYDKFVGTATVNKCLLDFSFWEITWVTVSEPFRRHGIGRLLIEEAEKFIQSRAKMWPADSLVVQLTTTLPGWYQKMGYKSVTDLGKGSHLMLKSLPLSDDRL